jgi:hypothetical protein
VSFSWPPLQPSDNDLNIKGIKNRQAMSRHYREWRNTVGSQSPERTVVLEGEQKKNIVVVCVMTPRTLLGGKQYYGGTSLLKIKVLIVTQE